jgi:hypothetical protein
LPDHSWSLSSLSDCGSEPKASGPLLIRSDFRIRMTFFSNYFWTEQNVLYPRSMNILLELPIPTMEFKFLTERFSSRECNIENMLDASKGYGHCRWCGSRMSGEYPKGGRALRHRCCSAACQGLYGEHLGYWELPLNDKHEIDFKALEELIKAKEGVTMHRKKYPTWLRKGEEQDSPKEASRKCKNTTCSTHFLPTEARKNQEYCDHACQQAAYEARKRLGSLEIAL